MCTQEEAYLSLTKLKVIFAESDTTEGLNWLTEGNIKVILINTLSSSPSGSFCFKCIKAFFWRQFTFPMYTWSPALEKNLVTESVAVSPTCIQEFILNHILMVDSLQISSVLSMQVSPPQYSALKTWATLVALVLSAPSPQFGDLQAFHWLHLQVLHRPNSLKAASWNSNRDEMSLFKIKFNFAFCTISEDCTLCLTNYSFKYIYMKWSEVKWSRSFVSDSLRPHGL